MYPRKDGVCPVASAYISRVHHNFKLSLNATLYGELLSKAHALLLEVGQPHRFDVSPTAQRLRGFYCLEVVYGKVLPVAMARAEDPFPTPGILIRRERTWKDLNDLVGALEQLVGSVKVLGVEIDLMGAQGADALLKTHLDRLKFVLVSLMKGATLMRSQLKREVPEIGALGTIAAECAKVTEETPMQQFLWGVALTNIASNNGLTPWST